MLRVSWRCPRQIDVAAVMETLRHIALAEGEKPAARDLYVFHRVFLEMVERGGRLYELGVGALFNGLSGKPLTNVALFPRMLAKGKLGVIPHRAKGTNEVRAIFDRVAALEGKVAAPRGQQEGQTHG